MNTKKLYRNNLQKYRAYNGLTQVELASKLDIHANTLRYIEKQVSYPQDRNIKVILDFFGVSYNQMFYEVTKDEF
jgi:DNA-binding XRE family transcriptional regulator